MHICVRVHPASPLGVLDAGWTAAAPASSAAAAAPSAAAHPRPRLRRPPPRPHWGFQTRPGPRLCCHPLEILLRSTANPSYSAVKKKNISHSSAGQIYRDCILDLRKLSIPTCVHRTACTYWPLNLRESWRQFSPNCSTPSYLLLQLYTFIPTSSYLHLHIYIFKSAFIAMCRNRNSTRSSLQCENMQLLTKRQKKPIHLIQRNILIIIHNICYITYLVITHNIFYSSLCNIRDIFHVEYSYPHIYIYLKLHNLYVYLCICHIFIYLYLLAGLHDIYMPNYAIFVILLILNI